MSGNRNNPINAKFAIIAGILVVLIWLLNCPAQAAPTADLELLDSDPTGNAYVRMDKITMHAIFSGTAPLTVTYSCTEGCSATGTITDTGTPGSEDFLFEGLVSGTNKVQLKVVESGGAEATDTMTLWRESGYSAKMRASGFPEAAPEEPKADLTVAMSDSPDPVDESANLSYNIEVINIGNTSASGKVFLYLPQGTTYVSNSLDCIHDSGVVHCNMPAVSPPGVSEGEEPIFSYEVSVIASMPAVTADTSKTAVVVVKAHHPETNYENNSDSETTSVRNLIVPDISFEAENTNVCTRSTGVGQFSDGATTYVRIPLYETQGARYIDCTVNVPFAGTYSFWIRERKSSTGSDSYFFQVDGQAIGDSTAHQMSHTNHESMFGAWYYDQLNSGPFGGAVRRYVTFGTTGNHTIRISNRESAEIDKVYGYADNNQAMPQGATIELSSVTPVKCTTTGCPAIITGENFNPNVYVRFADRYNTSPVLSAAGDSITAQLPPKQYAGDYPLVVRNSNGVESAPYSFHYDQDTVFETPGEVEAPETPTTNTAIVVAQDGTGDFTTIQAALNSIDTYPDELGANIWVKDGLYNESVKITEAQGVLSCDAENPCTIQPYPGHSGATIDPGNGVYQSGDATNPGIAIDRNWWIIDGFEIQHGYHGIVVEGTNVTVRNTNIHNNSHHGIYVKAGDIILDNNRINGNGVDKNIDTGIDACRIGGVSDSKNCHGIYIADELCSHPHDFEIRRNIVSFHGGFGLYMSGKDAGCTAEQGDEHVYYAFVKNNLFRDNAGGIALDEKNDYHTINFNTVVATTYPDAADYVNTTLAPVLLYINDSPKGSGTNDNQIRANIWYATTADTKGVHESNVAGEDNAIWANVWKVAFQTFIWRDITHTAPDQGFNTHYRYFSGRDSDGEINPVDMKFVPGDLTYHITQDSPAREQLTTLTDCAQYDYDKETRPLNEFCDAGFDEVLWEEPPICHDDDNDNYFREPDCGTAVDCNDTNADINPGETEVCYNNIDDNCIGGIDEDCPPCDDNDNDGYYAQEACPGDQDCNDANIAVHPNQVESCYTDYDDNCVLGANENCPCQDADDDGYYLQDYCAGDTDCNDNDNSIYPGNTEICTDQKDNDCDGTINDGCPSCTDGDNDGYFVEATGCGTPDCNDNNPDISPGDPEVCGNEDDDNCSGTVNENCPTCTDADNDDHYPDTTAFCQYPTLWDCDDNDPQVYTGHLEVCDNTKDDDCDGTINQNPPCITCTDGDSDTYFLEPDCAGDTDCDDGNININPGHAEVCPTATVPNNTDDDCDGVVNENCPPICTDNDGDGYSGVNLPACGLLDCNDNNPDISPGDPEICFDSIDQDCDGTLNNGCPTCTDSDRDGYYFQNSSCPGAQDCDDTDEFVCPNATQCPDVCGDGVNNDCAGGIDDGCPAENNIIRVHPTNPLWFTNGSKYSDGTYKAIAAFGSHTWNNFQDFALLAGGSFNFTNYINWVDGSYALGGVTQDFNFVRFWQLDEPTFGPSIRNETCYSNWSAWGNIYPDPYMLSTTAGQTNKFDLTKLNTTANGFFARLESRVAAAASRGIYVGVMLFDGNWVDNPFTGNPKWNCSFYNPLNNVNGAQLGSITKDTVYTTQNTWLWNNVHKPYIHKVIDTLNEYDNVIFEVCNECPKKETTNDWQEAVINEIKAYEQANYPNRRHLVWFSSPKWAPGAPFNGCNGNTSYSNSAWNTGGNDARMNTSPAEVQSWCSQTENAVTASKPNLKPNIADTDHFSPVSTVAPQVWKAFLDGNHFIFMEFFTNSDPTGQVDNEVSVRKSMTDAKKWSEKITLSRMSIGDAYSPQSYVLANRTGGEYLAYQPTASASITMNLQPGTYDVQWFDTETTGTWASRHNYPADRVVNTTSDITFAPPSANHRLLYLKRVQQTCTDNDDDGYFVEDSCDTTPNNTDCNDDPNDNGADFCPNATQCPEICPTATVPNNRDEDCDGTINDGCVEPCRDNDGDGYWHREDCDTTPNNVDCNDGSNLICPNDVQCHEICPEPGSPNNADEDCDGTINDGCPDPCLDTDADGFYNREGCGTAVDCNDSSNTFCPSETQCPEVCNDNLDQDCDNAPDDGCPECTDSDGDGVYAELACSNPKDCDDQDGQNFPGNTEICTDQKDNDCDGVVNEDCGEGITYYIKPDGDDSKDCKSKLNACRTMEVAAGKLQPGDTLIVMDGTWTKPAFPGCLYTPNGVPGYSLGGCTNPIYNRDATIATDRPRPTPCTEVKTATTKAAPAKIACTGATGTTNARDGTPGKRITVKAENERKALFLGNGLYPAFQMDNCDYWTIEGLRFANIYRNQSYPAYDPDNPKPCTTKDYTNGDFAHALHIHDSPYLYFRRNLVTNAGMASAGDHCALMQHNGWSVYEENEFYKCAQHAADMKTGQEWPNVVARRNYVNGRGVGREAQSIYPGKYSVVENAIVEDVKACISGRERPSYLYHFGNLMRECSEDCELADNREQREENPINFYQHNVCYKSSEGYPIACQSGTTVKNASLFNVGYGFMGGCANKALCDTQAWQNKGGAPYYGTFKCPQETGTNDVAINKACCVSYGCGYWDSITGYCYLGQRYWQDCAHRGVNILMEGINKLAMRVYDSSKTADLGPQKGWKFEYINVTGTNNLYSPANDTVCEYESTRPDYGKCFQNITQDVPWGMWHKNSVTTELPQGKGCMAYIPGGKGAGTSTYPSPTNPCILDPHNASTPLTGQKVDCSTPNSSSNMARAGKGGDDIGATIIYQYHSGYDNINTMSGTFHFGKLTNVKLWCQANDERQNCKNTDAQGNYLTTVNVGQFSGCGAVVPGVNDPQTWPNSACKNAHLRFNIGLGGCPVP